MTRTHCRNLSESQPEPVIALRESSAGDRSIGRKDRLPMSLPELLLTIQTTCDFAFPTFCEHQLQDRMRLVIIAPPYNRVASDLFPQPHGLRSARCARNGGKVMFKIALCILGYTLCGVLAYGFSFAHFQKQAPRFTAHNRRFSLLMACCGPAGLLASFFLSGHWRDGIRFKG
jgi:hypothetical protein